MATMGKPGTKNSDAAPPRKLLGDGAPFRYRMSKVHCAGLIQIRAEFCAPSAYPRPGSRVTTTLYA